MDTRRSTHPLEPRSGRPAAATATRHRHGRRLLVGLLGVVLAGYAAAVGLLAWQQEALLFRPATLPSGHRFDLGPDVHETTIDVPGAQLHALHLRLPRPDGVVFFLHGNAGNLDGWFVNADFYRRANLDLFMLDYRGYGKSGGHIDSEAQLMDDVRRSWQIVAPRYAGLRRVIVGRSLGSGLAAQLAAEVQPELTVLISPYVSMAALAREHYPWVPDGVLRYPLRSDLAVPRIGTPVLLVHGGKDTLIAPWHSEHLLQLAPRGRLLRVPEAGHNDLQRFDSYLVGLRSALTTP